MRKIRLWLDTLGFSGGHLEVASADASFRSYYRYVVDGQSYVVMDSSLQKESLSPFIDITRRLTEVQVHVPKIYAENLEEGFLLLEDLGSSDLLGVLDEQNIVLYYRKAMDEIVKMQKAETKGLPLYGADFLRFEMELMEEWYLSKYLCLDLDAGEKHLVNETIDCITLEVLKQPQGLFVHRDFHSRNLMVTDSDEIAVIDYQDARVGAVTYDLVSLLRDLYITFDPALIERLALEFRDRKGLEVDDVTFLRWFDFMGLQRHIKVLGIFSRLSLRDGKDGYLEDIPQTLKYIIDVGDKYDETRELVRFLSDLTLP